MEISLPIAAAGLRLHKDLSLHLFDPDGKRMGDIPLKGRMLSIQVQGSPGAPTSFLVQEDSPDDSLSIQWHLPLASLPPELEYYDDEPATGHRYANDWRFKVGFQPDPEGGRNGTLTGIGTVDIADISIGPLPNSAARVSGGCRLWRCLFPSPQPSPKSQGLLGVPSGFPESKDLEMQIRIEVRLAADKLDSGAQHIRIGAFIGQTSSDSPESPYLSLCLNPAFTQLHSWPILPPKKN